MGQVKSPRMYTVESNNVVPANNTQAMPSFSYFPPAVHAVSPNAASSGDEILIFGTDLGGALSAAGGIVKEPNGTVLLWYSLHNASNSGGTSGVTALAVSTDDGATFTKPLLGLNGPTNFLSGNPMENGVQSVWLDPHAASSDERYKGQHEDAVRSQAP
jgi:hypothetical protein